MSDYEVTFGPAEVDVSDEEYKKAMRGIQMDKANPGSLPIEALRMFAGDIERYRSQKPRATSTPKGVAPALPLEPGTADHSNVTAALDASEAYDAYQKQHFDQGLKSASKRKDLYAPPSFHPPPDPATLAAADRPISLLHPIDAAGTVFSMLKGAKKALPTAVGGDVEHYYEPGVDLFRKQMAANGMPQAEVARLNESDTRYREFADLMWKDIYEKAAANGKPVVRHAYEETPGAGDKVVHAAVTGAGAVGSAAQGFGEGAFFGVPNLGQKAVEGGGANAAAVESAFPLSHDLGMAAGMLNPLSFGAKIAAGGKALVGKGVAKAFGAKEAASIPGRLAAGGLGGAAASGATSAGIDTLSGDERLTPGEIGKRALIAFALGLPLGMAGEGLGMSAERLRRTSSLGQAKKLGARTSVLHGVKADKITVALRAEAEARDLTPRELLASELEEPIWRYAHEERGRLTEIAGRENAAAYKALEGNEPTYRPLLDTLTDAHAEMMQHGGGKVPFTQGHQMLRQEIAQMADVRVVPAGARRSMSVADAERRGFDVAKAFKEADIPEDMGSDVAISVEPKRVDAKGLDIAIRGVDEMRDSGVLGKYHASQFQEAARQVRDEFGTDFAAMKERHAAAFSDLDKRLQLSGISGKVRERGLDAAQTEGLLGNVRHYDGSESVPKAEALRSVAEGAGVRDKLERIRQIRALEDLEKRTKLSASLRLSGGDIGPKAFISADPIRFRADPIARYLSPTLGTGGALAPRYGDRNRIPGGASQADIDQISRMLNTGSPFP